MLFPHQPDFARAAAKSFRLMQEAAFDFDETDVRVYDHSFYLLFMAWYFQLTGDPLSIQLLKDRYALIEWHLDNAGAGGFGPQTAGIRSHNPYMHLLEALLTAFRSTGDDYWLTQARSIGDLFLTRLFDRDKRVVFEFLNPDWSPTTEGRVEIGHQLEWPTLLFELHDLTGGPELLAAADSLYQFALRYGFENDAVIDAVNAEGAPLDRKRLLWGQLEAARHFAIRGKRFQDEASRFRASAQWRRVHEHFFHANGWTWYNRISPEGTPVEEPSVARLLYHVVTATADSGCSDDH